MQRHTIDPAPRDYPSFVTLMRRGRVDRADVDATAGSDIEAWLLSAAADEPDMLELFQAFVWRLVAADYPLDRASLHMGTLHPQLFGYAWNWTLADGFCDEVKIDEAVLGTDAYRKNPLYRVIEHGERIHARTDDPDAARDMPLLSELAAQGITEYVAVPLPAGGDFHNAATVATRRSGGFSAEHAREIRHFLSIFALHIQRHIAVRISENVVNTYLGAAAGRQVLRGSIKRGAGAPIEAIIWASDLRGFTDLADRLGDEQMTAVLNEYFDRLAGAAMAPGGEVLKFIGDGLLAVFPFSDFDSERDAADAALSAAEAALAAVDALSADEAVLADIDGWRPLRSGIALHRGEVFFGNVGAPERLDFTVIGRAVNAVSRVEGLSKTLGRPILITGAAAALMSRPLDMLGEHDLRGFSAPLEIYAPKA